jgi:beta-ring hydroxylase
MQVTTNFAYLPFGGGRRKCIGDQFALFESVVALAMLLRRYTFASDPDAPSIGMTTGATIHTTNGLQVLLKPREHAEDPPHLNNRTAAAATGARVAECAAGLEAAASASAKVEA